jgi:hypothetical protein
MVTERFLRIEPSQWHVNSLQSRRFQGAVDHWHNTALAPHIAMKARAKCLVGSQRISRQDHRLCRIQSILSQTRTPIGAQTRQQQHGESNEPLDHPPSRFPPLSESLAHARSFRQPQKIPLPDFRQMREPQYSLGHSARAK